MLKGRIEKDVKLALKKGDSSTLSTLRFLNSKIQNKEIEKQEKATDEEVVQIIRKQIKELEEAARLFKKGGRNELARQNKEQIKILSSYLPAEMSDEKLKTALKKIIEEKKDLYDKNPKAVIGICVSRLKLKANPKRIVDTFNSISA